MTPKKRLEIIVDGALQDKVLKLLTNHGVTGYTILPALSGEGPEGAWRGEGLIADVGQMVMILCILDAAKLSILETILPPFLDKHQAICTVSDVMVFRPSIF
jgi:nitrogen regulatory protein PII